jgi:hypothetical protein
MKIGNAQILIFGASGLAKSHPEFLLFFAIEYGPLTLVLAAYVT